MRQPRTHRRTLLTLGAVGLLASSGCLFGDDGNSGDALPSDPEELAVLDDIAGGIASMSFDIATSSLQVLIQSSEGIPVARVYSWNPEDQAWTFSESETYDGEEATGVYSLNWWVQFRAAGAPQQQPDETTDQIEVRLDATNVGTYHPGAYQVTFDWTADHHVTGSRQPDNSATFVGGGTLTGETTTTLHERTFHNTHDASWSIDLAAAPDQACVSGTLSGTKGPWSFDATFDGLGGYSWELHRHDLLVDSGMGEYACAPPR